MKNYVRESFNPETTSWALQINFINKCLCIPGLTTSESSSKNVFVKFTYCVRCLIVLSWPVFALYSVFDESNNTVRFDAILSSFEGIHAFMKFCFLWLRKETRNKLFAIIIATTTPSGEHSQKYRILISKILAWNSFMYLLGAIVYCSVPLLQSKKWSLPEQLRIIGTSYEKHPDYEINYTFELIQFCFALPTVVCFNSVFYLCCIFTVSRFDLCKRYCKCIGNKTTEYNSEDKQSELLDSLATIHAEAIDFLNKFKSLFENYVLVNILTLMGILCMCIVQSLTEIYFKVFLGILVCIDEMFIYSVFGQLIINKNEEFINEIYDSNWYELNDIKNRKTMFLILLNAQKCDGFNIKGFFKLSLEKYAEILKACYVFVAFLRNIT